jgi:hypothetical protein
MREGLEPKNKGPGVEKETVNSNPFYLLATGGIDHGTLHDADGRASIQGYGNDMGRISREMG